MDSLTHIVAGGLTPLAFKRAPKTTALVIFGMIAGSFPDMDVIFGSSPEAFMNMHRGITHALVVQPLSALLLAGIFYFLFTKKITGQWRKNNGDFGFKTLFGIALLALYVHVFLDCMTTFGTQILLPFSNARIGMPAMFIVDLLCTLPALALLIAALRSRREASGAVPAKTRLLSRLGIIWLIVYPLGSLAVGSSVASGLEAQLLPQVPYSALKGGEAQEPDKRLFVITEPFSPFVWKVVVDDGASWRMGTMHLFSGEGLSEMKTYPKPAPELLVEFGKQDGIFGSYGKFCPLLTYTESSLEESKGENLDAFSTQDAEKYYTFMDLRYVASPESPLHWVGRTQVYFAMEAIVNRDGSLLCWRFLHNSDDQTDPWCVPRG